MATLLRSIGNCKSAKRIKKRNFFYYIKASQIGERKKNNDKTKTVFFISKQKLNSEHDNKCDKISGFFSFGSNITGNITIAFYYDVTIFCIQADAKHPF